ncbi:14062_t:CDS:1, partial [Dentiscutata heterogama]
IHIINDSTILSTSIDQRLNLWSITFKNLVNNGEISEQNEESKFELIKSEFVDVCDPSCMDVLRINGGNDKNDKLMIAISG